MKSRFLFALVGAALIVCSAGAFAQTVQPKLFIKADPNFSVALSAALQKKDVPVTVVLDEKGADYILQSSIVASQEESGVSKLARCAFAYCAGIGGASNVSVQVVNVKDNSVVWAYQVRKGNSGRQRNVDAHENWFR